MRSRRRTVTGILAVLVILLAAAAILLAVLGIQKKRYEKQLSLGDKYLAELDYENAEICFEKAISIQEKKAAPYLKLAAVYLYQGRTQDAEDILREGSEKVTDDKGLESIRENLEIQSLRMTAVRIRRNPRIRRQKGVTNPWRRRRPQTAAPLSAMRETGITGSTARRILRTRLSLALIWRWRGSPRI